MKFVSFVPATMLVCSFKVSCPCPKSISLGVQFEHVLKEYEKWSNSLRVHVYILCVYVCFHTFVTWAFLCVFVSLIRYFCACACFCLPHIELVFLPVGSSESSRVKGRAATQINEVNVRFHRCLASPASLTLSSAISRPCEETRLQNGSVSHLPWMCAVQCLWPCML